MSARWLVIGAQCAGDDPLSHGAVGTTHRLFLLRTISHLRESACLLLIVLAGLSLRVAAIFLFAHTPESDELAYLSMATSLLGGGPITDHMGNLAMYNMGYPIFVIYPILAVFGDDLLFVKLANALLGCLSIVLVYFVARECRATRFARLLAATAWAVYLPASVYGVYLAKENLMIPLMLGLVWCALKIINGSFPHRIALFAGLLLGALALTGNAALSLIGSVVLAMMLARKTVSAKALYLGVILAASVLVTTPWLFRNSVVLGAPVLNTNGGFNLYLGNNPDATGWFVSIADTPRGPTWNDLRKIGEVEASETLKREAIAWIKENPAEFLVLAAKKVLYFWMPPFHGTGSSTSTAENLVRLLWAIQFSVLVLAAIAGVFVADGSRRSFAVLWTALFCYTAAHMAFYVIFRYREPIMPILVVIASLNIDSLWRRFGRHRSAVSQPTRTALVTE